MLSDIYAQGYVYYCEAIQLRCQHKGFVKIHHHRELGVQFLDRF